MRTVVDRARPYVGQQVTVTIYLYTRNPLRGSMSITQEPTTEGFWVQDLLPPSRSLDATTQVVRGIDFQVYVIRRLAAFPLRAGELTIGATGIAVSGGGFFDLFGGGGGSPPLNRFGVPVTVTAIDPPAENRPSGEVHVGTLELESEIDRAQVATGDAVQLTVTARGTGAIQQVNLANPSVEGLRVLEPEIDDQIASPNDVVGGSRVYRWLIVPEREGRFSLGPFEVAVFDPQAGTYSVARAPARELVAAGNAPGGEASPDERESARAEAQPLVVGPIRTRSELARSHHRLVDESWLPFAFLLGPMIFGAALIVRAARRRAGMDPARAPKRAQREARKRLAAAEKHAQAKEPREFYSAIASGIKELLEAKLGRAVGSLTHPELRALLVERGMNAELAEGIVDELEGCDFARFSAVGVSPSEMSGCLERTRTLLSGLDRFQPRAEEQG